MGVVRHREDGASAHVYFGGAVNTAGVELLQFPVIKGIVQQTPSATYGGMGSPIAARGSELYATVGPDNPVYNIEVFSVPSLTPLRSISIPQYPGGLCVEVGLYTLTVSRQGYLYVDFSCEAANGDGPLYGVFVFAPGAGGSDPPLQTFFLPDGGGVATDDRENLYVSLASYSEVEVFAHPMKDPKLVRTISGPDMGSPQGLAIDESGELYVDCVSDILAYPHRASGTPNPDRIIIPSNGGDPFWSDQMAVLGPHLFTVAGDGFDELRKRVNGPQTPLVYVQTDEYFVPGVAAGP
jgi:hypothetical protein